MDDVPRPRHSVRGVHLFRLQASQYSCVCQSLDSAAFRIPTNLHEGACLVVSDSDCACTGDCAAWHKNGTVQDDFDLA